MAYKIFFNFHSKPGNWLVAQVRNMGVVEWYKPVTDNKWEEANSGGDKTIQ